MQLFFSSISHNNSFPSFAQELVGPKVILALLFCNQPTKRRLVDKPSNNSTFPSPTSPSLAPITLAFPAPITGNKAPEAATTNLIFPSGFTSSSKSARGV
ncbi:unnamed protein product, partial [Closterium sp. NIES-54]